jgi:phage tail-like protein
MTCAAGKPNFRLLDCNVGWDQDDKPTDEHPAPTVNLAGFDQATGVRLAALDPNALDPNEIFPYLPPALLAPGCGACEWYLLTPAPPASRLLRRDACHSHWVPVEYDGCARHSFVKGAGVACWRKCVAVSDQGANSVYVWARKGKRLLAKISIAAPGPIAFFPNGDLLISNAGSPALARYSLGGDFRGQLKAPLPLQAAAQGGPPGTPPPTVSSIAVDPDENVWVLLQIGDSFTLWRAASGAALFVQQLDVTLLQNTFPKTGLAVAAKAGFCFNEDTKHGLGVLTCFSWYGRDVKSCDVQPYLPPQRYTQGQMITLELDSGVPRCEWHRVRLDADVPAGTALLAAVATTEDPNPPTLGDASRDTGWTNFPPGKPHFSDWTAGPAGSLDFLINQPPGRYLFFRLRLRGDGIHTPVVRRVRLDFPRVTSLDRLPDVYRETPKAEDFTKRFLSLFDSSIADLDALIQRYPALLAAGGVPDELLPWLASFFDITFDPTWDADTRRKILNVVPQLYKQRGTSAALQSAVKTIFGVSPAITESPSTGPWGSVASRKVLNEERCHPSGNQLETQRNVTLGSTRLFGRNTTRLRLNRSALGSAPLRSFGDPDQDPFNTGAYRLQILIPPFPGMNAQQITRLTNVVDAQKPAHTVASIRVGGAGFLLGVWSAVGVDTLFAPLAPPVLGTQGNVRLNRMSILGSDAGEIGRNAGLGVNSVVGTQTIAG